jgi:hypothetical protein
MTVKNKKQVTAYFQRKLGRDPFSSSKIKARGQAHRVPGQIMRESNLKRRPE